MKNTKPQYKPNQEITIHRDGTVSYFSIMNSHWDRCRADHLCCRSDYQTLTDSDRQRIGKAVKNLSNLF